jgi:hypothetical protein
MPVPTERASGAPEVKIMPAEKVVRREVHEAGVEDAVTTTTRPKVVKEKVEETVETTQPPTGATNVNVNRDPVSGNVNVNTPDGTQVNINS